MKTTTLITITAALAASALVRAQDLGAFDHSGDGIVDGEDLGQLLIRWGDTYAPQLDSVHASASLVTGGTELVIYGRHLRSATAVTIGGAVVPKITAASATSLTVVAPAGAAGAADVVVTTPYGTATLPNGVVYSGSSLSWATTLEFDPDPAIIVDPATREAIAAVGLPWRVRDTTSAIELVLVPPGTFTMGTPDSDPQQIPNEQPQHSVTISQPFYIGRYETTQAQWIAAMGWNSSVFGGYPDSLNRPVELVTWHQVHQFMTNTGLRLPTEAEWEYAARGGSQEPRYGPIDLVAWWGSCYGPAGCSGNANGQTHQVGQLSANGFGLSDTLGNVWEWVEDWYGPYTAGSRSDPTGPPTGVEKVLRGGSWYDPDFNCRVSRRDRRHPDTHMTHPNLSGLGFRVARTP